jgi:hypothetical protein
VHPPVVVVVAPPRRAEVPPPLVLITPTPVHLTVLGVDVLGKALAPLHCSGVAEPELLLIWVSGVYAHAADEDCLLFATAPGLTCQAGKDACAGSYPPLPNPHVVGTKKQWFGSTQAITTSSVSPVLLLIDASTNPDPCFGRVTFP